MDDRWQTLPPIRPPTPVTALAGGPGGVWAGGAGGVAWLPASGDWLPQISGLPVTSVAALAHAGGWLLAGGAGGIARSSDGGRSWRPADTGGPIGAVTAIAVSPSFDQDYTALAATLGAGVLRSSDAGRHWQPATFGLETLEATDLLWLGGEEVLLATADGAYRSPNGGRAWRRCAGTEGAPLAALAAGPDGALFAAVELGGLLRAPGAHARWERHGDLPPDIRITALHAARSGSLLLGSVDHGLLRSCDGGATWQRVADGMALAFATAGGDIYAGTESGALRSGDGGATWEPLPAPPLHDLRRLLVARESLVVAGIHSPPVRLAGAEWQALESCPLPLTGMAAGPDGALLASSPAGLARSEDGGRSWRTVVPGAQGCVARITLREDGAGWAGSADGARLLRTSDGGRTWIPIPSPFGVLPLAALQALPAAGPDDAPLLLAATYDPRRQAALLWRSADGGATWERGLEARTSWPIAAAHDRPALIALGNLLLVRRGADRWERTALPGEVRRVVGDGDTLLALTTAGLLRSDDAGARWRAAGEALPAEQLMDIALGGGFLWALLAGGEVRRRPWP